MPVVGDLENNEIEQRDEVWQESMHICALGVQKAD